MFDRLLVNPRVLAIHEALVEAQRAANAVFITLKHEPEEWQEIAAGLRDRPEGRMQWMRTRSGQRGWVGLTWWTDDEARRHFRVIGASMWDSQGKEGPYGAWANAPPIATLYRGVCIYRQHADADGWVQLCGCGAVVPVGSPGWMGSRCVACHAPDGKGLSCPDRRLMRATRFEGGTGLINVGPETLVVRRGATGEGDAALCDLEGTVRMPLPAVKEPRTAACMNDGRYLAYIGDAPRFPRTGRLVVLDLRDGRCLVNHVLDAECRSLRFSPDGSVLFLSVQPGRYFVWREQERCWWPSFTERKVKDIVWSPRGDRTLWLGTIPMVSGSDRPLMPLELPVDSGQLEFEQCAFGEDIDSVAAICRGAPEGKNAATPVWLLRWAWDGVRWSLRYRISLGRRRASHRQHEWRDEPSEEGPMIYCTFSPDGRWLAGVWIDDTIRVYDVASGTPVGRVGWPRVCRPHALHFTPDGRSLVAAETAMLRVVPWAHLLNVPASAGG